MATGPKCADKVQNYIMQTMRNHVSGDLYDEIVSTDSSYNGEEEWSIGSVFEDRNLKFSEHDDEITPKAQDSFRSLDKAYDAIKDTKSGGASYSKLEGLKAFGDYDVEMPTDNRKTRNNWVQDYKEAGLVDVDLDKSDTRPQDVGELTEIGEMMIQTTEELENDIFEGLDMDVGQAYRKLSTQGYGSTEANNGTRIQAFFMYGSGMGHTSIGRETGSSVSTVRTMAEELEGDLLTEDNMWTPEGRDFANVVLEQIKYF